MKIIILQGKQWAIKRVTIHLLGFAVSLSACLTLCIFHRPVMHSFIYKKFSTPARDVIIIFIALSMMLKSLNCKYIRSVSTVCIYNFPAPVQGVTMYYYDLIGLWNRESPW